MPIPAVKYDLNLGVNTAKAKNDLNSGQLTEATGIYYKHGSDECYFKIGRTAYNASALGANNGLVYAEFTGADPQLFIRAGTSFSRGDVALTGSYITITSSLVDGALGLWSTFHTNKYYFNDGVNPPWVMQYVDTDGDDIPEYFYRTAGLFPPTEQPVVTVNQTGDSQFTLTSSTVVNGPTATKLFDNLNNVSDDNLNSCATVSINNGGVFAIMKSTAFTGTGQGTREDWVLALTYETVLTNNGKCTVTIEYTIDGGSSYLPYSVETSAAGALTKKTVYKVFTTSVDSANLGWKLTVKKTGDPGRSDCRIYDTRCFNPQGVGIADNDLATGVYYWVTERVDYLGISSIAGPVSLLSGPATDAASIKVTLPSAPVNPLTTHYDLWRTADGGAFPVGTLVGSFKISESAAFDDGPLNQVAGTQTYGAFTVGGLYYHRDVVPPIATVMTTYQNSVVVAPVEFPNQIRYSVTDFPDSFPTINVIKMGSDRDDTVRALIPLSSQLGVFMAGRCRRLDHLPTSSDPTFGVAPEDFAPDHGIESRNGWCYLTPPAGVHSHIAYVARDGIRVTDLYTSTLITNNFNWDQTVDVDFLSTSFVRNNPSNNRIEFYCTPAPEFIEEMGWPTGTNLVIWLHYQMTDNYQPTAMRATFHPANFSAVELVPIASRDYIYGLTDGVKIAAGTMYVDEVGSLDNSQSWDTSGTIPIRITTGQVYLDSNSRLTRTNLERLVVDSDIREEPYLMTVFAGRDDTGSEWSVTRAYDCTHGGAKPLWFHVSGQWHQIGLVGDTTVAQATKVRNFSWTLSDYGEFR